MGERWGDFALVLLFAPGASCLGASASADPTFDFRPRTFDLDPADRSHAFSLRSLIFDFRSSIIVQEIPHEAAAFDRLLVEQAMAGAG